MNINLAELLILAFATWRITNLLVDDNETGPYQVLPWLRDNLGVYYDEKNRKLGRNELGNMLLCPWCTSIWVGAIIALGYIFLPQLTLALTLLFALSGMALTIRAILHK
jgi:hypothetical protein